MNLDGIRPWQLHAGGLACCVLMTVAGWMTVVEPIRADREVLAGLRAEYDAESRRADDLKASRRRLTAELARIVEERDAIGLDLQSEQQLNQRLADLTGIVDAVGMTLQQTNVGQPGSDEWYRTVPLRLTGGGSFNQASRFLHELHAAMRDVRVVAFSLSGKPGVPGSPSTFSFDLVWFAAPTLVRVAE